MRILCTTSSFDKKLFPSEFEVEFNPYNRKLSEQEVTDLVLRVNPVAIVAGVEPLTKNVLEKAKSLKVISRCGAGIDSIDLEAAKALGIKVVNTPDAATIAVAELTIGLILNMIRQINVSDASIRDGKWHRPMGHLLNGKTIGIIGCGRIGTCVAGLLSNFGCKVLGYDTFLDKHEILELVSLKQLLSQSDIISLHLPYSSDVDGFFGNKEMKQMRQNSFIVNASRGKLLDEDALYENLLNGHLKGAAIDCFEQEPYTGKLKNIKNIVLTAHIGSYAIEARELQEKQAVENLIYELGELDLID